MDAFEQLRVKHHAGDLCLLVCAGVSMGCGLPAGKNLAQEVVEMFPRKPGPPLSIDISRRSTRATATNRPQRSFRLYRKRPRNRRPDGLDALRQPIPMS